MWIIMSRKKSWSKYGHNPMQNSYKSQAKSFICSKINLGHKSSDVKIEQIALQLWRFMWIIAVHSCELYNNKYMIASAQITGTEFFPFIAVLVFKLLSRKVFLKNKRQKELLNSRLFFKKMASFMSKLLQNVK